MHTQKILVLAVVLAQVVSGCTKIKKITSSKGQEVETTIGATLDRQLENLSKETSSANLDGKKSSSLYSNSGKLSDLSAFTSQNTKYNYLVYFSNIADAEKHQAEVQKLGAEVTTLAEGKLLKVEGDKLALSEVTIPASTPVTLNLPVLWNAPKNHSEGRLAMSGGSSATLNAMDSSAKAKSLTNTKAANANVANTNEAREFAADQEVLIESLWTARKITGVDELQKRFPNADGHGLKVAVFDTGIDFGVEGVQTGADGSQKLVGFYDLVGYGKVGTRAIDKVEEKDGFRQLQWTDELGNAQQVVMDPSIEGTYSPVRVGVLDEAKAARSYLSNQIDINDNESFNDQFVFAILRNNKGALEVAVDANLDKTFDKSEVLGDFNATYSYVDTRKEVAPSGARPLAVTILSENEVQFHTVPGGHGTSCGIIIAGEGYANGRLRGLAPKAKLLAYVLDVQGQDVYSIDQFLQMFSHAKAQGVDAISISWGFATADLVSARFVSEFIEKEIGDAGILVAIAAGNEGPGSQSAAPDDYIPRNGYGVGALLTPEQARNVYRWTGATKDAVIFYSSQGPTRGGRSMPDVVSPLMTWVRGQRTTAGPVFEGFGGTSSATPALVGSTMALVSALKDAGYSKIDQRILKLAIQRAARPLEAKTKGETGSDKLVDPLTQGAGVLQVDKAYDWYVQLIEEQKRAEADVTKRTPFAYELKPKVLLRNHSEAALEGIVIDAPTSLPVNQVEVQVVLSPATQKLIDPLVTVEPVLIRHSGKGLKTPEILPIQSTGNRFVVSILPEAYVPGQIYTDTIELVRPVDQVVLARIPVLIRVPAQARSASNGAKNGAVLANFQEVLAPEEYIRIPVELREATSLVLEGLLREVTAGSKAILGIQIYNNDGVKISDERIPHARAWENIRYQSPLLQAGRYEVTVYRAFPRPSSLGTIDLTGVLRTQSIRIAGKRQLPENYLFALEAIDDLDFNRAQMRVEGVRLATAAPRSALGQFVGEINLATAVGSAEGNTTDSVKPLGPVKDFKLNLVQDQFDRVTQNLLHAEVVLIDKLTDEVVYRGWVNQQAEGSGAGSDISLSSPAAQLQVIVYPNIVKWPDFLTQELKVEFEIPLTEAIESEWIESAVALREGESRTLQFLPKAGQSLPTANTFGMGTTVYGSVLFRKGDALAELVRF